MFFFSRLISQILALKGYILWPNFSLNGWVKNKKISRTPTNWIRVLQVILRSQTQNFLFYFTLKTTSAQVKVIKRGVHNIKHLEKCSFRLSQTLILHGDTEFIQSEPHYYSSPPVFIKIMPIISFGHIVVLWTSIGLWEFLSSEIIIRVHVTFDYVI